MTHPGCTEGQERLCMVCLNSSPMNAELVVHMYPCIQDASGISQDTFNLLKLHWVGGDGGYLTCI